MHEAIILILKKHCGQQGQQNIRSTKSALPTNNCASGRGQVEYHNREFWKDNYFCGDDDWARCTQCTAPCFGNRFHMIKSSADFFI